MQKYCLEFILYIYSGNIDIIKASLSEFGEGIEIGPCQEDNDKDKKKNLKVSMITDDPTAVFDVCAEFGRIKSAKVNEE